MPDRLRTLTKRGGSIAINLPPDFLRTASLHDGDNVIVTIDRNNAITIRKLISSQLTPTQPEKTKCSTAR
jgi:antitoxin component of MazEF toxin-antitoxin module